MTLSKTLNELKALVLCGAVILFAQWVNTVRGGTTMEFLTAVVGMFIIILISMLSLKIKQLLPWKIPAFAWASILGLLVTTPWCPFPAGSSGFHQCRDHRRGEQCHSGCGRRIQWHQAF